MKKTYRVRTTNGYGELNLPNFATLLNNISGKMNGNPNFPEQSQLCKDLLLMQSDYLTLAEKAVKGSTENRMSRDKKRLEIVSLLHTMGDQVTAVCNGDMQKMVSSGFPHTNPPTSAAPLGKPPAPKVSTGLANRQIICLGVRPKSANIEFMIAPVPATEGGWKTFGSKKASYTFTGLISGQEYLVKYAVLGSKNQRLESDAVPLRPQ